MNVSVGRELEDYVRGKVDTGDYASASEVVRDGLRLLKEKDKLFEEKLRAVREMIQKGVDEAEAGMLLDGPETMDSLGKALRRIDET